MNEGIADWAGILTDPAKKEGYIRYVNEWEEKINSFIEFDPDRTSASSTGDFENIPFAVKDNIAVKSFRLTCGSRILENLLSPYTATAVRRLQNVGAVVVGKTNMDEFGMGSSNENSAFGPANNPWDPGRVTGGSSGGSAAAVASGLVPFALGTDTGGSVRQPAAFCGVYGLKPTYGAVSRYGLTAYASSLEIIGILAKQVTVMRDVFDVIRGADPMDHSSLNLSNSVEKRSKDEVMTIGLLKEPMSLESRIESGYKTAVEMIEQLGHRVVEVELPTLDYVVPAYYTIAMAEASANLARYNGIRYGRRAEGVTNPEELVKASRSNGFGDEVKLRILIGTYVLRSGFQDQYYIRAQKIRTAIRNDLNRIFSSVDALLTPAFPTPAFRHGSEEMDPFQQKMADKFTSTANLAGVPAITFPVSVVEGVPVGMQLLAPAFEEQTLFTLASQMERLFPAPNPPGYKQEWG
jgi:aspartyl-tRNA(Asn)/glutamyl-tRNA(Gln) amidotransferase subunit A